MTTHASWIRSEVLAWPPFPSVPASVDAVDWPQLGFVAKCGGRLEIGDAGFGLGGFSFRRAREDAELVARCELVERFLALEEVFTLLRDSDIYECPSALEAGFDPWMRWDSRECTKVEADAPRIAASRVLIGGEGAESNGLGFGRAPRRALQHATLEVLERALFGAVWYSGTAALVESGAGETTDAGLSIRYFFVAGAGTVLPMCVAVGTARDVPGIYCGLALRTSHRQARDAALFEATMLLSDARRGHSSRLQGDSPHDRVMRIRGTEVAERTEAMLVERTTRARLPHFRGSFSSVVIRCLEALSAPESPESNRGASLQVVRIIARPRLHLYRAVLDGAPTLRELRARHAGHMLHDPIA